MSSALANLEQLPPHDPSGGSDKCTIAVPLPDGVSLLQASTLTPCDTNFQPLVDTDFELRNVEIGIIDEALNTHGANFWPYKGTGLSMVYITLTPYYSNGLPGIPGEDITVRLPIEET